jgi:hypothetical protein
MSNNYDINMDDEWSDDQYISQEQGILYWDGDHPDFDGNPRIWSQCREPSAEGILSFQHHENNRRTA